MGERAREKRGANNAGDSSRTARGALIAIAVADVAVSPLRGRPLCVLFLFSGEPPFFFCAARGVASSFSFLLLCAEGGWGWVLSFRRAEKLCSVSRDD